MQHVGIIGSGFAGLSAAAYAAKQGYKVTVFEKNTTIGGRARQFSKQGFKFDMGPSWYWMPDVFEDFFRYFGKTTSDYYDLKLLDPSFSIFFGRDNEMQVPESHDMLNAMFDATEPGSSVKFQKFISEAKYKYEVGMRDLVHKPSASLTEFLDLRLLKGLLRMHVFNSMSAHVRKYFSSKKLIQLMEFPVLFLGGTPENTPALYSLMNYAGLMLGTWYPIGGMVKVIEGMINVAETYGVEFKTNAEITKIDVKKGKVEGVQLNGDFFPADAIIAGADYHHVEQELLEPEYRKYNEAYWDSRVLAPSSLIFYLGVSKKIRKLQHHNLFFDEDLEQHAKEIYKDQKWPTKPLFYVCCPSKTDPEVAPDGHENLFVLMPIAPGLKDDEQTHEKYYQIIMSRLEKVIGENITSFVVYKKCYSIEDFKKDYHSYKGNAYGLANTLRQTAIFKPSLRSKKVAGLFFTGQLTVPGPGVPPSLISGKVAANEVIKYLGGNHERAI